MSTIRMHQTTTLTPAQYVAGLTDFGLGRSKLFDNSPDEYMKVHSRARADVTEGSGGIWGSCSYRSISCVPGCFVLNGPAKSQVWIRDVIRIVIADNSPRHLCETGLPIAASEKSSGSIATAATSVRSPQSGLLNNIAKNGHLSRISGGERQIFSAVQTEWRRTQSRANQSLARNSLPAGKNTGNFADS